MDRLPARALPVPELAHRRRGADVALPTAPAAAPSRRDRCAPTCSRPSASPIGGGDKVGTFSKGMQQRLGLAVALSGDPELVILDEPTSALDPVGRHDVREIIRGLRSRGTTVFLNTHLLEEAEHVCDRVTRDRRGTLDRDRAPSPTSSAPRRVCA